MNQLLRTHCILSIAALALASCGGEGSSGSSPPPIGVTPTPTPAPAPPFGFAAPFSFTTSVGLEVEQFTYTDPVSSFPRQDIISAQLLSPSRSAVVAFQPQPDAARLSLGGTDFNYSSPQGTNPRTYFQDGRTFSIGPLAAATTHVTYATQRWPDEARVVNAIPGTVTPFFISIFGNVSTDPTPIVTPTARSHFYLGNTIPVRDLFLRATRYNLSSDPNIGVSFGMTLYRQEATREVDIGVIEFRGKHDPLTNHVEGTISDATHGVIGRFRGALYGPNRDAMGLVFEFTRPQEANRKYIGYDIAPREQI